jgi:septum formation protein
MDFSGEAKVFFEPMDDAEIDFYVSTYRPFDKAGAYAVQEWIGLCKISRIEGTYSNIMGLPMDLVYKALKTFI